MFTQIDPCDGRSFPPALILNPRYSRESFANRPQYQLAQRQLGKPAGLAVTEPAASGADLQVLGPALTVERHRQVVFRRAEVDETEPQVSKLSAAWCTPERIASPPVLRPLRRSWVRRCRSRSCLRPWSAASPTLASWSVALRTARRSEQEKLSPAWIRRARGFHL
jgi:hypothetical protein